MSLQSISVQQFRNIKTAELDFSPGLNIIHGANAAGKTSLLEAIYFLGRARSFRSNQTRRLIHRDASAFELFTRVTNNQSAAIPVGINYSNQGLLARINGENVQRLSDLARVFPLQIVAGDIHQILNDGPRYRRRFLDWGLFHVEPSYAQYWRRYSRVLKQRNAALRQKASTSHIKAWDEDLINAGSQLDDFRKHYVKQISSIFCKYFNGLVIEQQNSSLHYHAGLPAGRTFAECLCEHLEKDREQGYTRYGAHRADLNFLSHGVDLLPTLSRGQEKLLVIALQLAQTALLLKDRNAGCLFLLDDIGAELDSVSQDRVMALLAQSGAQVFITAIEPQAFQDITSEIPRKMFHVEHGKVEVVL